ncbi:MAG: hypothetical protein GXY42_00200 [Desulfovibrionales bacterium]|nr:hypothetical protein [Desulfovibrionales bacterium]
MDLNEKERSADRIVLAVTLEPEDAFFREHFPGNPVAPGSFIIALCLRVIGDTLAHGKPMRVKRFGFSRFAPPGTYTLCLERDMGSYDCTLRQGQDVVAQGRIEA